MLVDKLLKDIPIAEDLYFLKYYKNGLALMFNLANVAAILNKVTYLLLLLFTNGI